MEGEQRFSIPLDSPLDINSNDMLVPASSPKFSFNRQRYLGSVLQNSVRYEADGWFAGWWVHNFVPVSVGTVTINPDTIGFPTLQDKIIPGQMQKKYWIVKFNDVNLEFRFAPETYENWITGSGAVNRIDDATVTINGTTTTGDTFSATVDPYTGNVISFTSPNTELSSIGYQSNGVFTFIASRPNEGGDFIYLRYGENFTLSNLSFAYSYDGTDHNWGDFITVTNGVPTMGTDYGYVLIDFTPAAVDTASESYDLHLQSVGMFHIDDEIETTKVGAYDNFNSFTPDENDTGYVDYKNTTTITGRDAVSKTRLKVYNNYPNDPVLPITWNSYIDAAYSLPIWLKIGQLFDIRFEMNIYERTILPPSGATINSWYYCDLIMAISRREKQSSLQQVITELNARWDITIAGQTYNESQIPTDVNNPLLITVADHVDSRVLATIWPMTARAINDNLDTTGYPLPYDYEYGNVTFNLEIQKPAWTEIPPPPPMWLRDNLLDAESWREWLFPVDPIPADWTGPVAYEAWPNMWPPQPATWEDNPVSYAAIYDDWAATTPPVDWANPIPIGSLTWPAAPFDWDEGTMPWATYIAGKNFGVEDEVSSDWALYTSVAYVTFCDVAPTGWPSTVPWPVATAADWDPPWPPVWPFGIAALPVNIWFSASETYTQWIQTYEPTNWPGFFAWPFVPTGGWQPLVGGAPNPAEPPNWLGLPYPPEWPFGIAGLPANEWYDPTQTYEEFVEANPLTDWPLPWAWQRTHIEAGLSIWPLEVTEAGWEPRTGSPGNWTVNTTAPTDWQPDWPIWWPFGITAQPPEWYSISVSYDDWINNHIPFKPVAADWSTGGDPGYAWPGHYFIDPASAFPSKPDWEYPIELPDDYELYTGDPYDINDPIVFNPDPPENWPTYVTVDVLSRGTANSVEIGEDYNPLNGHPDFDYTVLNRNSIFAEDAHLFGSDDQGEFVKRMRLRALFPFCTLGHLVFRIDTIDVTQFIDGAASIQAFAMRTVPNSEVGVRLFRLDTNDYDEDYKLFSLETLEAYIMAIDGGTAKDLVPTYPLVGAVYALKISYDNVKGVQFDKPIDYMWPTRPIADPPLSNMQAQIPKQYLIEYGFYPEWIVPSYGGQAFWVKYSNFSGTYAITSDCQVQVWYCVWLSGLAKSTLTYTPMNDINLEFSTTLQDSTFIPQNPAGRNVPWEPGLFGENILVTYDKSTSNHIDLVYDVRFYTPIITWVPDPPDPWGPSYDAAMSIDVLPGEIPKMEVHFTIDLERRSDIYTKLYRSFIISQGGLLIPAVISSATANGITLNDPYGNIIRDSGTWENHPGLTEIDQTRTTTTIRLVAGILNEAHVDYVPEGIFWYNKKVIYLSWTGNVLTFVYDGVTYELTLGDDVKSKLVFLATDIRDDTTRELASLDTSLISMAVKQFWSNDVDVENFWWIDSDHVLALTKYEMVLYEKLPLLDDWMGDRWQVLKHSARGNFVDNADLYYGVTAAYKQLPALIKMQNNGTSVKLLVIYDIQATDFLNPVWTEYTIPVSVIDVPSAGAILSVTGISSFVPLNITAMLSSSRISSTVVSSATGTPVLMVGIVLTRGLQQWVSLPQSGRVINGYGHVSHKGDLTGGQYPEHACNTNGFNGRVYPIADFKDYNAITNPVSGPDNKIFISGASIWFVRTNWTNIVSHFTWNNGVHTPQIIPLACNYHVVSSRSGHKTSALFDTIPRSLTIIDIIATSGATNNSAQTALSYFSAIAMPSLWFMQPVLVNAVISAQGLEQAAYVIRNSLPVKSDDGKSDKDNNVIRASYEISISLDLGKVQAMVALILGIIGSVVGAVAADDLKVEASKDANTIDDTSGRKLGQFATQAIMDGVATAITTKGMVLSAKTKTTEILSLSMFYTINDGVECWAGPGFVNHNFIGQAIAQGVASTKLKLDRYGAYFPLQMISKLLLKGQQTVVELLADKTHDIFDNPGGTAGGGLFVQVPVLWLAAAIANLAVAAADRLVKLYEYMAEALPDLYKTLGDSGRGFYAGGTERNVIEPEATHSYGNKPMSMFWPAFGFDSAPRNSITVESVRGHIGWDGVAVEQGGFLNCIVIEQWDHPQKNTNINDYFWHKQASVFSRPFFGDIYLPRTSIIPSAKVNQLLPQDMACVEGIVNMFQPESELKNLQVNCCDYTFPAPPIHDYVISQAYKVGVQAANGEIIAYSMDDTKILDGPASNIVETDSFFGIASSYTAIEIKDAYNHDYLRPWAVTPTCIGLNISGFNVVQMAQAYHGFDGQFNRITSWKGGNGLDSATMVQQYCIIVNDHFKRSNIIPPSEFFGLFNGVPSIAMKSLGKDRVANQVMDLTRQKGMDINIPGEDRDLTRYAIPVHSETISTLPATVRMLAPYKLHVVEGVTSLTTDVRSTQTKYKAPSSVDFNLYDTMYRATEEYVALLELQDGVVAVTDKVPSAGLTFIGATTEEAFFYSPATRMYYSFSGSGAIQKRDIFNRFKDIRNGRWDFVNQEVVFKMLLDDNILDDDVDGYFVARLDQRNVVGEIYPPNATVYNQRSDFKILSMAGGLVYQGPKRCVVNRWVVTDDMYDMIRRNKKRWQKLEREAWEPGRDYHWAYDDWHTEAPFEAVHGWTHNAWRAATAMLGTVEETDSLFEWELTFAWTEQINHIFEQNEYISFNLAGETIGQGGTLLSRPTHLFLYRELFKNGYYTTRYSSKNGIGNRERLYMWGDGVVALESFALYIKDITTRRAQPIATAQVDVQNLIEQ
jgi:hypothetical protein